MKARTVRLWSVVHTWTSLISTVFLLLLCLTGLPLIFHHEIDELLGYRCAGRIVVGPDLHARDLEPLGKEVAVVEVGRDVSHGLIDVIRNDDAIGTRQAVDHLVSLGHQAIAFIDGGENPGAGTL